MQSEFVSLNVKTLTDIYLREKMAFWKDLILSLKPKGQIIELNSKGLHSTQTTSYQRLKTLS